MSNEAALEKCIEKLEQIVTGLQHKLDPKSDSKSPMNRLIGSVSDESAFLEALEYGRAYRQSGEIIEKKDELS